MTAFSALKNTICRLNTHRLVKISGADATKFLQGLTTQDMTHLTKNNTSSCYTAFLTPKGRILADGTLLSLPKDQSGDESTYLLECHSSSLDQLLRHFKRYKLRSKVSVEALDEQEYPIWATTSDIAVDAAKLENSDLISYPDPRAAMSGWKFIAQNEQSLPVRSDTDISLDDAMYDDNRLLQGVLEGSELEDRIPAESNIELLNGVCFSKGCYVGQELTARTQFKGNVRKRVVPVLFVDAAEARTTENDILNTIKLATEGQFPALSSSAVASGTNLHTSDEANKRVGQCIVSSSRHGLGVAQVRLETLYSSPAVSLITADKQHQAIPFCPAWWPELERETGKMEL